MKREGRKASLRCAIYTRVSTENGLEQEFNSLDNQREASEGCCQSNGGSAPHIATHSLVADHLRGKGAPLR
jgi:DNA invertase Pin-like site-specific DNA recombinase